MVVPQTDHVLSLLLLPLVLMLEMITSVVLEKSVHQALTEVSKKS